jgi:2-succinyl-5-enolpyruvyl-6-hydroxy-3-cyclohexene-1-carboxylate synthase
VHQHIHFLASLCIQQGVEHVVICPGSRSAPIVYAFASNPHFTCHSVVDERSAAYMALGMAVSLRKPVVLVCTSGTAAANFYPAIAEACFQHVPLIILTADRPQAMLGQQDGQMIDQHELYGSHVRAFYTFNPLHTPDKAKLISILALAKQPNPGPVHINIPLSEPLYPNRIETFNFKPIEFIQEYKTELLPSGLVKQWNQCTKKLILVGQWPVDAALGAQLRRLANDDCTVVIADITSNQFKHNTAKQIDFLLSKSDKASRSEMQPDLVISLGGSILSKQLKKWLSSFKPSIHIRINWPGEKVDTYHNVTHHLASNNPSLILDNLHGQQVTPSRYKLFWQQANELCAKALNTYLQKAIWSEPHAMHRCLKQLADTTNLHLGNSSIIRHAASSAHIHSSWIVNSNRGTSGIDGSTSTALGAAMVNQRETVLITGDISFFYDFQPWLHHASTQPLKVILMNNGGGRIFDWIEGPSIHPNYLHYFTTPHTKDVKVLMQALGIQYVQAKSISELELSLPLLLEANHSIILECLFNPVKNQAAIKRMSQLKL